MPKPIVKRTKTFHGCWTCRARHLKCDTGRPSCERCMKSNLTCEGYGNRLSWDDERGQESLNGKKRQSFSTEDMKNPIFEQKEIDTALELLDIVDVGAEGRIEGPYSVFSANPGSETANTVEELCMRNLFAPPITEELFSSLHTISERSESLNFNGLSNSSSQYDANIHSKVRRPRGNSTNRIETQKCVMNGTHVPNNQTNQLKLPPHIKEYTKASTETLQLLRCWEISTSSIMISTGHSENPYRHVFVPIALTALRDGADLPGPAALLHSIFAFTASHLARGEQGENARRSNQRAITHYQRGIQCLRQSMSSKDPMQHGATLATMIMFATMNVVNGKASEWRIHLQGGRSWLKSIASTWANVSDNHIIYQLFRGLEVFGYTHDGSNQPHIRSMKDSQCSSSALQNIEEGTEETLEDIEPFFAVASAGYGEAHYCMDKYFGLTLPILNAILKTNSLIKQGIILTTEELHHLNHDILLSNPGNLRFPSHNDLLERLTRHHSFTFYFALSVQHKRSLCRCSSADIRYVVEDGLHEFEAIAKFETEINLGASGLLWPLYILAAEASDDAIRQRYLTIFQHRKRRSLAATNHIEDIVKEVWRRRDCSSRPDEIDRYAVMQELGFDVLLT